MVADIPRRHDHHVRLVLLDDAEAHDARVFLLERVCSGSAKETPEKPSALNEIPKNEPV